MLHSCITLIVKTSTEQGSDEVDEGWTHVLIIAGYIDALPHSLMPCYATSLAVNVCLHIQASTGKRTCTHTKDIIKDTQAYVDNHMHLYLYTCVCIHVCGSPHA